MNNLSKKIEKYKKLFNNSTDFIVRNFVAFKNQNVSAMFIDGSVDKQFLISGMIEPLQQCKNEPKDNIADFVINTLIGFVQAKKETQSQAVVQNLLNGFCALVFENTNEIVLVDSTKWITRPPVEPPTSAVTRGPREGFVEDVMTNCVLLRKRFKTPDFVFEQIVLGKYTNTSVKIAYIKSIADPKVVSSLKEKLSKINIDGIIDSNYIAELLTTKRHYVFRQVGQAEKPDIIAAKLLEGRVAILVDGSPIVLTVPFCLIEDLQSSNDYYSSPMRATITRIMRFLGIILAILLPSTYVAILSYHYNIIPIKFLVNIANSIQGIPLSPFLEVLFIIFLFEMLYEASLRMPRYLGLALSVVGALILGDTAVNAGLVSPPAVMLVALTGVMSYTVPEQSQQISFLRLIFTVVGGVLGLFGIVLGTIFLVAYLSNMDSFGTSYLSPMSPYIKNDQKDAFIKVPTGAMKYRPKSIPNINSKRQ